MRRFVLLAVLLSLGLAAGLSGAAAQEAQVKHKVIPGAGKPKPNLRGSQPVNAKPAQNAKPTAVPAANSGSGPTAMGLAPTAALLPSPSGDGGQCRMGCAQTYYFCAASPDDSDCASTWGQCASACNRPPR